MSALPAPPAPASVLWGAAQPPVLLAQRPPLPSQHTFALVPSQTPPQKPAQTPPALTSPVLPQHAVPARMDGSLGLDKALCWDGLEARLSPVIGRHGLVALYHRSVALSRRARGPDGPLAPAQAFAQLLAELLGSELAEQLLPKPAPHR